MNKDEQKMNKTDEHKRKTPCDKGFNLYILHHPHSICNLQNCIVNYGSAIYKGFNEVVFIVRYSFSPFIIKVDEH